MAYRFSPMIVALACAFAGCAASPPPLVTPEGRLPDPNKDADVCFERAVSRKVSAGEIPGQATDSKTTYYVVEGDLYKTILAECVARTGQPSRYYSRKDFMTEKRTKISLD